MIRETLIILLLSTHLIREDITPILLSYIILISFSYYKKLIFLMMSHEC